MKKYIMIIAASLVIASCKSDLEQVVYNTDDAIPATIESINESAVLDIMTPTEVAMTIRWSEADFGYSASVTNNIEMDLAGGDFTRATTLASLGKTTEFSINHADLNNSIAKLLAAHDQTIVVEATKFDIRISSTISTAVQSIISEIVTTTITPYYGERKYASIALRGDYNGWDFDNAQRLYSKNDDENYAGMIYFDGAAANGWKLCGDASWATNWGVSGTEEAEQSKITLISGGDNFMIYSENSYYFEFNTSTLKFSMSKPHDSWGIVGSLNDWGDTADIAMSLGNTDNEFYLEATVDFATGDEWKIRADNEWNDSVGCSDIVVNDDSYTTDTGNFTITESGNYTIKWFFNRVEQRIEIIKN